MKKRSGKNLIQWFYHFLVVLFMAMPLMSTLVRCLYVQFNHNAFESYNAVRTEYEITKEYSTNNVSSISDLVVGNIYELRFSNLPVLNTDTKICELSYFETIRTDTGVSYFMYSSYGISLYYNYNNGIPRISIYNRFGGNINNIPIEQLNFNKIYFVYYANFNNDFLYMVNSSDYLGNDILTSYEVVDTLDNAFDYSIEKTYNEYKDTTLVDFTSFFNNVFIDYTDNLYMNFATWYIGWVLSCAIVSFVPYVLLSFYHLAIHVIDKFSRKGENL